MFSRSMAVENLIHLINSVPYQKLPREWNTNDTQSAVMRVVDKAGKWFEHQVCANLNDIGFKGSGMSNRIRNRDVVIPIPKDVGQLDFLGFNEIENILLLVECKMSLTGLEARFWRDDLDRFVRRKKSYRKQLLRKLNWVKENHMTIGGCFGAQNNYKIATVMVTLYPCIADEIIEEFRCVSLTELMLDYKLKSSWPYDLAMQVIDAT